ncbi:hypothetical protein IKE71_00415 [Candidatus Saccharibacteria bacterium]|nr:hypothetical protein [Candidatus Saccharibacteria bacterium]
MSEERERKMIASAPATPAAPSIMSAPRENNKVRTTLILTVAIIASLVLNVVFLVSSLSKNERLTQLESEIVEQKKLNNELKEKVTSLENF